MASTYRQSTHDIGLTNAAGSLIGMMITELDDGTPAYREFDDEYLARQFFSGEPSPSGLPPEREINFTQSDWRRGYGQQFYDSTDPRRYFESYGMDLRFKGAAICGPVVSSITMPTVTAYAGTNLNLDTWSQSTYPDSWVKSGLATTSEESTTVHTAGGSAIKFDDAGARETTMTQQITAAPAADIKGRIVYLEAWVYPDTATQCYVRVFDGTDTTTSSANTGTGAWEQLYVKHTMNGSAAQLDIVLLYDNDSGVQEIAYFDDVTLSVPSKGPIAAFAEFNDELYIAWGNMLCKLDADPATSCSYVTSFNNTISDLEAFTDNQLYIALGSAHNYWEMTTAEAFTQNTQLAENYFEFFQTVYTATSVMWGNIDGDTIFSNTDPSDAGASEWGSELTVGSAADDITGLIDKSGALYIMKEDMPYYLDSTPAVQNDLAPELRSDRRSTSGKGVHLWKNNLYIPAGETTLLESGASNTDRTPSGYITNGTISGRVTAIGSDGQWLYIAIEQGTTKNYILAGRNETIDGTTSWVWHPFIVTTNTATSLTVNRMFVSTVFTKRLYLGTDNTGSASLLKYVLLPSNYGDITGDTNYTSLTDTYFVTPWLDLNFRNTSKAFTELTLDMGHTFNANRYFEAHYEVLGDVGWTDIGDFKGASGNMITSNYIPADSSSNNPVSTMIRFKFVAKTNSTTTTPVLLSYTVKAILYPTKRRIIACTVRAADEVITNEGIENMYDDVKTCIDNLRDATWPVLMEDIDSTAVYVKLLPLPENTPRWQPVKIEQGRKQERYYNLLLQIVPLS